MASTAAFTIAGVIRGLPEGAENLSIAITNSTAVGVTQRTTLSSGIANASTNVIPADARIALFVPDPTASGPWRLAASTQASSVGALGLPSTGVALIPVSTVRNLTFWTTWASSNSYFRLSLY